MSLTFIEATRADLPQVVAIYNQIIPSRLATADLRPVTVASRIEWFNAFNHERRPLWLLKSDAEIVGWVGLELFYGRPAYVHTAEISIYLDQHFQHQGLGQQALDYVISQLPRLEVDTLLAYVFSHNLPSQKLFQRNGFARWAHLPEVALMDGQKRSLDILGRHF
ncbi:GNAT family N-acetyltransferase [Lapidilactobacillus bayanensis]|uniref:GNAT family N-acetyltransferase n=1 Tax=Lapidilactobacillus bayanensis TaxID=2485998 RepID=UPI000F7A84EC|nr:GNAT family N-acetyltransferase [Lapidilactobacillus bayanensis]